MIEARRDDRDLDGARHRLVVDAAEEDLGVGVRDEIQIKVEMTVEPTASHIAAARP